MMPPRPALVKLRLFRDFSDIERYFTRTPIL